MKKNIFAICLSCLLLTACGIQNETGSNSTVENNVSVTENQKAENISTGYVNVPDGQEYVELHQTANDSNIVARMYMAEPITVYSIDSDWASVSYGGMKGYVELKYISFSKPEKNAEKVETTVSIVETTAENNEVPIKSTENIQKAEAENIQNDVDIENSLNITFLVDGDGVKVAQPLSYPAYVEKNQGNAWCSATSIYIYSEPSTNSYKREADMLYYGDVCEILGTMDDWYFISTDSGNGYDLHGYVKKKYISSGNTPVAEEPANASYGVVSVGSANVRSSPNKDNNSNVLFTVYKGEEFTVLDYDGYWYKINYNGTVCYISHKMVDVW